MAATEVLSVRDFGRLPTPPDPKSSVDPFAELTADTLEGYMTDLERGNDPLSQTLFQMIEEPLPVTTIDQARQAVRNRRLKSYLGAETTPQVVADRLAVYGLALVSLAEPDIQDAGVTGTLYEEIHRRIYPPSDIKPDISPVTYKPSQPIDLKSFFVRQSDILIIRDQHRPDITPHLVTSQKEIAIVSMLLNSQQPIAPAKLCEMLYGEGGVTRRQIYRTYNNIASLNEKLRPFGLKIRMSADESENIRGYVISEVDPTKLSREEKRAELTTKRQKQLQLLRTLVANPDLATSEIREQFESLRTDRKRASTATNIYRTLRSLAYYLLNRDQEVDNLESSERETLEQIKRFMLDLDLTRGEFDQWLEFKSGIVSPLTSRDIATITEFLLRKQKQLSLSEHIKPNLARQLTEKSRLKNGQKSVSQEALAKLRKWSLQRAFAITGDDTTYKKIFDSVTDSHARYFLKYFKRNRAELAEKLRFASGQS